MKVEIIKVGDLYAARIVHLFGLIKGSWIDLNTQETWTLDHHQSRFCVGELDKVKRAADCYMAFKKAKHVEYLR